METKTIYIEDLHFEHQNWQKELLFWKDELKSFNNRLEELVQRWTDRRVLAELDQFQNQFFIHKTAINEFIEQINTHELEIAARLKSNNESLNVSLCNMHHAFREKMDMERKLFQKLKQRFFKFLGKYM
ncbi:hypothetical protein [Ascidiimonas sp. W6]|uniref:hypothetical protein n=1 Tax=Ascidiimonas meishanensis TaxID=3128903 RepID=UPI0030EF1212